MGKHNCNSSSGTYNCKNEIYDFYSSSWPLLKSTPHPHPSSSVYPVEAVLDSELETLVLSDLQLPVLQLPTLITVESPAAREMVSALLASSVTAPVETDSPTHSANKSSFKCL